VTTELGQRNYYHVFGLDLAEHVRRVCGPGQRWWIEAIRLPDDEFDSVEPGPANYERVGELNRKKRGEPWDEDDFRACHTVAAVLSGSPDVCSTLPGGTGP